MSEARRLARSLAAAIAADPAVAAACANPPRVFLDGLADTVQFDDGAPLVLVSRKSDEGLARGDETFAIDVVFAVNSDVELGSNAAAADAGVDGVYEFGAAEILELLGNCIRDVILSRNWGALVDALSSEYNTANLPLQSGVFHITARIIRAFGD